MFQSGFRYRDFCWAVSSVTTRQNKIPLKGDSGSHDLALIPLWDMCNHIEGVITTDYDPVTRQCICYAAHPVAVGEEICIYYGPRPNSELLLHSGFVYADNRRDYLKIKLGEYTRYLCRTVMMGVVAAGIFLKNKVKLRFRGGRTLTVQLLTKCKFNH